MATNVRVARTTRARLRLDRTAIATVAEGGTVVDLDDPAIKRDVNRAQGRWVVLTDVTDSGAPVAAAGGVADAGESTLVVGDEAGNAIPVTLTLKDVTGTDVDGVRVVNCWLSSSATTGAVATDNVNIDITATTGAIMVEPTADLIFKCLTDANGVLVLSYASTADEATVYLWVEFPNGEVKVSGAINLAP